jgi:hypothetical protein
VAPDDLSRVQDRQSHLRSARARVQLVAPLELERLEMEESLYKDHFALLPGFLVCERRLAFGFDLARRSGW